ncbi:hypothetical protein L3X38_005085 [Prunus dulcis]|uniref:Uncharacterized protein n=1 Tax=Prunus dulcis TaxID=3755 RepID=A0AAD4ZQA3_PRUDU|nr:hypothetical protein L3X38_005085 [Prunus dulcis]
MARWWISCLGDTKSIRAANWQDSGDYSQPDLLAGLGDTKSTRAANWQDSGDRSQPDPQSWQVSVTQSQPESQILAGLGDTQSIRAANPGSQSERQILAGLSDTQSIRAANPSTHGPDVPETREANVKCTDKTEGKLDVCRHRHN